MANLRTGKGLVCVCSGAPVVRGQFGLQCTSGRLSPHAWARAEDVGRYPEPEKRLLPPEAQGKHGPDCWQKRGHHNCAAKKIRILLGEEDEDDQREECPTCGANLLDEDSKRCPDCEDYS